VTKSEKRNIGHAVAHVTVVRKRRDVPSHDQETRSTDLGLEIGLGIGVKKTRVVERIGRIKTGRKEVAIEIEKTGIGIEEIEMVRRDHVGIGRRNQGIMMRIRSQKKDLR